MIWLLWLVAMLANWEAVNSNRKGRGGGKRGSKGGGGAGRPAPTRRVTSMKLYETASDRRLLAVGFAKPVRTGKGTWNRIQQARGILEGRNAARGRKTPYHRTARHTGPGESGFRRGYTQATLLRRRGT
jgi:hypothetical protein